MYDTTELGSSTDTENQTPKERQIVLRNFIAYLRNPQVQFDMRVWNANRCGTAHCIGGWAQMLFYKGNYNDVHKCLEHQVGELLGLTDDQSDALFYPKIDRSWGEITSADAVKVLNHLIATDEVDWGVAGFKPSNRDHIDQ